LELGGLFGGGSLVFILIILKREKKGVAQCTTYNPDWLSKDLY